jgi:NDP-sugar pyrophosphorylase family protein
MRLIAGRPLLAHLVTWLAAQDFEPIVLSVGLGQERVRSYFSPLGTLGTRIVFVHSLGGTGAAVAAGLSQVGTPTVLLSQGDTIVDCPLQDLVRFHESHGREVTLVLSRRENAPNPNAFWVDSDGVVIHSSEGADQSAPLPESSTVSWRGASTGLLLVNTDALRRAATFLPAKAQVGQPTFERYLLPALIERAAVMAFDNGARLFIDIGTPQRLAYARRHSSQILSALVSTANKRA